jgi:hypothetical protein
MTIKFFLHVKVNSTESTSKGHRICFFLEVHWCPVSFKMCPLMFVAVPFLFETTTTNVAGIGTFTSVYAHMSVECVPTSETLITESAFKWSQI